MTPQKFFALMATGWVATVLGDAIWFRFVREPVRQITG